MANKDLVLSREDVLGIIKEFGTIQAEKVINPSAGCTRYTVLKDESSFMFDVWFKNSGRVKVASVGKSVLGEQLKEIFISKSRYPEIIGTSFAAKISEQVFLDLIEYLSQGVTNVSVGEAQDKGINGITYKITTNFGDVATITFWSSTGMFRFQGYMMAIYAEVRSFLLPQLPNEVNSTSNLVTTNLNGIEAASKKLINTLVPTYFSKANSHIQGLLEDSSKMLFLYKNKNISLSDYAPVPMSSLKVIEYRIKEICKGCGIIINDKKGFVFDESLPQNQSGKNIYVFVPVDNSGNGIKRVNPLTGIDEKYNQVLIDLYKYLEQNRHTTFHMKQEIKASKKIETIEEAQTVVTRAFELLEKSYISYI